MIEKIIYIFLVFTVHSAFGQANVFSNPCQLNDTQCIRYVLTENSDCNQRTWGSVPNPVIFNDVVYESPNFNVTIYEQTCVLRNLDQCRVSAFFFDRTRNRVVLAITCPNLISEADVAIAYHESLKEDKYYFYDIQTNLGPAIFTVDAPNADDIDLCNEFVFGYLTQIPSFSLAPKGPSARKFIQYGAGEAFFDQLNIYAREFISQRSNQMFRLWVNSVLCNFNDFCTN